MTARVPGAGDDGGPRNPREHESFEGDQTREGMGFAGIAQGRHTRRPAAQAAPIQGAGTDRAGADRAGADRAGADRAPAEVAPAERSDPIRVFSMKDHTARQRQTDEHRAPLHVQLRSLAEVAKRRHDTPPAGLGRLAPPRDPAQAKARHWRANAAWACVVVALAAAIALAIWLVAGRAG